MSDISDNAADTDRFFGWCLIGLVVLVVIYPAAYIGVVYLRENVFR